MAVLFGPDWGACNATPQIPGSSEARDYGEELRGGPAMGGRPDIQEEVQGAEDTEARRHGGWEFHEGCLEVLPRKDRSLPSGQYHQWAKSRPTARCWWC